MGNLQSTNEIVHLRLGTRGSMLARTQSQRVADALQRADPRVRVELVIVKTTGDRVQDRPLAELGGKGLFVKELEQQLLDGGIDFAVHSYKDVPVTQPLVATDRLHIAAVPLREDARDVLVAGAKPVGANTAGAKPAGANTAGAKLAGGAKPTDAPAASARVGSVDTTPVGSPSSGSHGSPGSPGSPRSSGGVGLPADGVGFSTIAMALADLPAGARVGTGSLRRRCQLLGMRADLSILPLRGNVDTRLARQRGGEFDAIVLAAAGLKRAGLFDPATMALITLDDMVPSPGQGALALQCRVDDLPTTQVLRLLHHGPTARCVHLEREVVRLLDADCHSPLGVFAEEKGGAIVLRAAEGAREGRGGDAETGGDGGDTREGRDVARKRAGAVRTARVEGTQDQFDWMARSVVEQLRA